MDIKESVSFNTKNLIYILGCYKCQVQYVGETSQTLQDRFSFWLKNKCFHCYITGWWVYLKVLKYITDEYKWYFSNSGSWKRQLPTWLVQCISSHKWNGISNVNLHSLVTFKFQDQSIFLKLINCCVTKIVTGTGHMTPSFKRDIYNELAFSPKIIPHHCGS